MKTMIHIFAAVFFLACDSSLDFSDPTLDNRIGLDVGKNF